MTKSVVLYLPEGYADWEGAFLMPELREAKKNIKVVSDSGDAVYSIGGLKTQVDGTITEIRPEETEALILIGSDSWAEADKNKKVLEMAQAFHKKGILVAAICAATVALARIGMLENVKHTSNDLPMLKKMVPQYRGDANYVEKLAVRDGNLITATGVGPIDFTFEVLKYLKVYSEKKVSQWYEMFKNGVKPPLEYWTSL